MAQPDFSIATHRVVRIDGEPLDYPARHIVIPDGVRAMPSARALAFGRAAISGASRRIRAAVAIARDASAFAQDWLGDNFDSPHGLAFYVAVLFPITIAAFCIGYFGLRELLAGFGL